MIDEFEMWIDAMEQFDGDTALSVIDAHLSLGAKSDQIKSSHNFGFLSGHAALLSELSRGNPSATVNSIMQMIADSKGAERTNMLTQLEVPNFDDVLGDAIQNGSINLPDINDSTDDDSGLRM